MILKQQYDEQEDQYIKESLKEAIPIDSFTVSEELIQKTLYAMKSDIPHTSTKKTKRRKRAVIRIVSASAAVFVLFISIKTKDLFSVKPDKVENDKLTMESASCDLRSMTEETEQAEPEAELKDQLPFNQILDEEDLGFGIEEKESTEGALEDSQFMLEDTCASKQGSMPIKLSDVLPISIEEITMISYQKTPDSDWTAYETMAEIKAQYQILDQYTLTECELLELEERMREGEGLEETYNFYIDQNHSQGYKIVVLDQYMTLSELDNENYMEEGIYKIGE